MLPAPRVSIDIELKQELKSLRIYSQIQMPSSMSELTSRTPLVSSSDLPQIKIFLCEICLQEFKTRQGLHQHFGKVHAPKVTGEVCPICDKMFRHKHALKFHVSQVHEKSTRVKCEECGKDFYNKYEAQKHFKKTHSNN